MDTQEFSIIDVVYRGAGLARRADGCVVMVRGALKGEVVRAEITAQHKSYAEARMVEILRPSAARIAPACPLTDVCPGCAYQHVSYEEEVRIKQAQLINMLERKGGVNPGSIRAPLASPCSAGYRNKLVLHPGTQNGSPVLGYIGFDNETVIDVPACPQAHPEINALLATLRDDKAFMEALKPGMTVTLRHTEKDGAVHWLGRGAPTPWLTEHTRVGDLLVPRGSFFQVNPSAADLVLAFAETLIEKIHPSALVDLYTGVGVFALAAAKAGVAHVLGVDSDRNAIKAARRNVRELKLPRIDFFERSAADSVKSALQPVKDMRALVIVDPPRTGLERPVVDSLCRTTPSDLLYISCAVDTLARDLSRLIEAGMSVSHCQLIDMFPRTPYFETVVHLKRKS